MKKEYEAQYHRVEEAHWWFLGRRHLVHALVLRANPDRGGAILEIGCSGGPLIQQLRADGYRQVTGIDISAEAIALAKARGLENTEVMDAQKLRFGDEQFDVLTASDVLEHLADAPGAVREWRRVLKPGGVLIVFVPAFQFLWTEHDELNRHVQRFDRPGLVKLLAGNGLRVERRSYWNFLLFLPVALVRTLRRALPRRQTADAAGDIFAVPAPLNWILRRLLEVENWCLLRGLNFPFGVSVMVVARKPRP